MPSGWNATFGMHRADLVEFLAAALPAGVVHTGHRATGFEQDGDVARVSFANGAVAEGDIVVAADGIHSELRPFVFPPSQPVFHGIGRLSRRCCRMSAFRIGRPTAG